MVVNSLVSSDRDAMVLKNKTESDNNSEMPARHQNEENAKGNVDD
jgi:hypothetical protein